jgi:hypothetical protein
MTPAAYAARFSVPLRIRLTRLDGAERIHRYCDIVKL